MLSNDILFIREAIQDPNNKLYVTVAMKFADLAPGDPVASISLELHNPPIPRDYDEYAIYDPSTYVNVPLTPIDGSSYGTNITQQTPSSIQDGYGNYLFEYYVDLSAVTSYMTGDGTSSIRQFYHINPKVYWHGNGKLIIDYIVIEDEVNRSVRQNPASPYLNYLESHINSMESIDTNNNLLYLYGKCEPVAGQLQIYKHTQNYLNTLTPPRKSITAVWLKNYNLIKHDNIRYNYQSRFLSEVNPDRIMVDIYPLVDNITWNNDMNSGESVQSRIDNMVHYFYHKLVTNIRDSINPDTEIFYVPQTFGNVLSATGMWSYNMPPQSMIKALKFLPLCYAADGTVDFCVAINPNIETEKGNWVTPLSHDGLGDDSYNNLRITDQVSAYNMITDANEKIAKYGPIIRNLNWLNANKLMTSGIESTAALDHDDQISLNSVLLNDLHVEAEVDATGYTGYVQCGYYHDSMGMPYYMLVNRRSVYKRAVSEIPPGTPLKSVDLFFNDAEPQEVCFEPDNNSHNIFGTHVALYDPYDNNAYQSISGEINVEVGPGDGVLLQMCSSLPASITSDAEIKNIAYLSGPITIDNCAEVTIHELTETTIFAHSTILVKGNSILNLAGTVTIADSVSIIVEQGSSINFNGAICFWGYGSGITIDASEMTATNCIFLSENLSQRWEGIHASNSSTISLDDTEINGAISNTVFNSHVYLSDCSFNVPAYSTGLLIDNDTGGHDVRITATVDGKGFFGKGMPSYGLAYGNQGNSTAIWKICFKDLSFGLANIYDTTIRDSIISCAFADNERGIYITGNHFSPYIFRCRLADNEIGIDLDCGASPEIRECTFENCEIGIKTELSSASSGGIYDCIFRKGLSTSNIGIVSRGSNLRVADNKFYTNYGILNHSGSILNMGNTAKNLFHAKIANFKFQDTVSYNAYVQLYLGHNDFYHETPGPLNQTYDFHFDSNWHLAPPRVRTINVSYNWFEDSIVKISCPGIPSNYVRYTALDLDPNVFLEVYERMAVALASEKEGDYLAANNTYRAILDEDLDAESLIMCDALDAFYRTSPLVGDTPSETEAYLLGKISQYASDNPVLKKYAEDYILKSYLNIKDYQAAIDMIQVRLTDPESEIDSLLAVMDLEIALQLAAMDASKRPITTKYTQYQYPNRKVYNVRHAEHWDKLNQFYNAEEDLVPIPTSSVVSSNYPNPFNPSTTISFSIPKDSRVLLTIFNIKGQKVKDLVSENMLRGHHKFVWDGRDDGNRKVSSGIYFVKLSAAGNSCTHKMMLMK